MTAAPTDRQRYDRAARQAASVVISRYSTSFGLATKMLGPRVRDDIRVVYALVRLADEIVDGPGRNAAATSGNLCERIDGLERETLSALESGFSSNLLVHAFAQTARRSDIRPAIIRPFFKAMRTDVTVTDHDQTSHDLYVYGSAEVVGLMCLQVFLNAGRTEAVQAPDHLVAGARRLGAAFQDINFLRDADHDRRILGRTYVDAETQAAQEEVLERIRSDLNAAARVIPELPGDCRRAVVAAHQLFSALTRRLTAGSGERVSVPTMSKALIALRASLGRPAPQVEA